MCTICVDEALEVQLARRIQRPDLGFGASKVAGLVGIDVLGLMSALPEVVGLGHGIQVSGPQELQVIICSGQEGLSGSGGGSAGLSS